MQQPHTTNDRSTKLAKEKPNDSEKMAQMYRFVVNNLLATAKRNEQNQNVNKRSNIMNAENGNIMEWDKNSIAFQIIIR